MIKIEDLEKETNYATKLAMRKEMLSLKRYLKSRNQVRKLKLANRRARKIRREEARAANLKKKLDTVQQELGALRNRFAEEFNSRMQVEAADGNPTG